MSRILMVCMGNLCRSPMAEAVALHLGRQQAGLPAGWAVESAGTHASRGRAPLDPRARDALARRGYALPKGKSRAIADKDFARFDLILAMDQDNMNALRKLCPGEHVHKLRMFLEYAPEAGLQEVPDPYYGSAQGFERVLDLCEAGVRGLLRALAAGTAR